VCCCAWAMALSLQVSSSGHALPMLGSRRQVLLPARPLRIRRASTRAPAGEGAGSTGAGPGPNSLEEALQVIKQRDQQLEARDQQLEARDRQLLLSRTKAVIAAIGAMVLMLMRLSTLR